MILVDTSVWVDHFRHSNQKLQAVLEEGLVLGHPFVVGELACGQLENRAQILGLLSALPSATVSKTDEVMSLLEREGLHGRGLGWVDVHLLASARLSGSSLWTLDRPLATAARQLRLSPPPPAR